MLGFRSLLCATHTGPQKRQLLQLSILEDRGVPAAGSKHSPVHAGTQQTPVTRRKQHTASFGQLAQPVTEPPQGNTSYSDKVTVPLLLSIAWTTWEIIISFALALFVTAVTYLHSAHSYQLQLPASACQVSSNLLTKVTDY